MDVGEEVDHYDATWKIYQLCCGVSRGMNNDKAKRLKKTSVQRKLHWKDSSLQAWSVSLLWSLVVKELDKQTFVELLTEQGLGVNARMDPAVDYHIDV